MKKAPISEGFNLAGLAEAYHFKNKQMKTNLKINFILIALCIMLYSCKCEYHLRKAKEMGCLANDTVTLIDTIKGWSVDTVFRSDTAILKAVDTFVIVKDGIRSTTLVRWKERLVTQEITKKDTIFKREHFTVKEIKTVEKIPWWVYLVFCLGGVAILGLIFKRFGG